MSRGIAPALLVALIAVGGCAGKAPISDHAPTSLDSIIAFADPANCELLPGTSKLFGQMVVINPEMTADPDEHLKPGSVPASLRDRFGAVKMAVHDGWRSFTVRTRGSVLGMPLYAVHQSFPEGGDPSDFQLEFAVPVSHAERRLSGLGFPARANGEVMMGEPDAYAHMMTLHPHPERPHHSLLGCGYY